MYTKLEVALVATRFIEKGAEVLTYYGRAYWDNHEVLSSNGVRLP